MDSMVRLWRVLVSLFVAPLSPSQSILCPSLPCSVPWEADLYGSNHHQCSLAFWLQVGVRLLEEWQEVSGHKVGEVGIFLPLASSFQAMFWWSLHSSTYCHSSCWAAPSVPALVLAVFPNTLPASYPLGLGRYWPVAAGNPTVLQHPLLTSLTPSLSLQIVPLLVSSVKPFGVCHLFPARSLANTRRQTNKYIIKVSHNKRFNRDICRVLWKHRKGAHNAKSFEFLCYSLLNHIFCLWLMMLVFFSFL